MYEIPKRRTGGMIQTGETETLGEKPVSLPLCPSQISHELAWDGIRDFTITSRRLTA